MISLNAQDTNKFYEVFKTPADKRNSNKLFVLSPEELQGLEDTAYLNTMPSIAHAALDSVQSHERFKIDWTNDSIEQV